MKLISKVIYKAFKTKIYPTKEQEEYFNKCFGISRLAYNWYVEKHKYCYENNIKKTYYDIRKEFNMLKNDKNFNFLQEINSKIYNHALYNANNAYKLFFNKISKYPKFKSKKNSKQSFGLCRCLVDITISKFSPYKKYKHKFNGYTFYIAGKQEKCGKMNGYFIKTSEDISFLKDKTIFQLTISKKNNIYYVSFEYKEENNYQNNNTKTVGIDLGIKTFATQSDNKVAMFPKQRILKYEKKIKKLQQVLSKKQKDSNNYLRTKSKLNKYYQKITNIKQDFLHKYTTYLAKNYKTIKIEDLDIQNWFKKKRFSKSLQKLSLGMFKPLLQYKTEYYNSNLIVIDRYYPSSKLCSVCGNKKKNLKLSDRVYICDCCNNKIDRDLNASINILNWN